MPAAELGVRPVPGVRTFGEQLDHITASTYGFAALVRHATPPSPPPAGSVRTSAHVVADLGSALAFAATAIAELLPDAARVSVPWGGRLYDDTPRLSLAGVVRVMHDHVSHHRGPLVVYLRRQGIEPPPYVD